MSKQLADYIEDTKSRFTELAPSSVAFTAERGYAMQLLSANEYLMNTARENPISLQQAMANVAAIGLSLNPAEKLAYLLPRRIKQGDRWVSKVCLEPSYIGLIRLATNSGSIKWIQASLVYESDNFIDNGVGEKPTHTYNAFSKERGGFVGVYAVAKTSDDDYLTEIMSDDDVYSIRDRSEQYKKHQKGTWVNDFGEMAKKACIRRLFKTLPLSHENSRMAQAVDISNQNEGFDAIETAPNLGDFTGEQKTHFDHLIEKSDGLGMVMFLSDLDERVKSNLYHSFEKGKKGQYQRIVDELNKSGSEIVGQYASALSESVNSNDLAGVCEVIDELSDDELDYVLSTCDSTTQLEVVKIKEQENV